MARGYFDAVCEHPYSASTADLWKLADIRQPYSREWNINAIDDVELIEYPDFV